jgi:hypothetical protein
MDKYQGDDIDFAMALNPENPGDVTTFEYFDDIIFYAYTSQNFISKFSKEEKQNYIKLKTSSGIISGIIPSEHTKLMRGNLLLDIRFSKSINSGDSFETSTYTVNTGVIIKNTPIKLETI